MSDSLQVTRIDSAASLEALNRSEIDIQISTAKKYPRIVNDSLGRIVALATVNPQTASECFYSLKRNGAEGVEFLRMWMCWQQTQEGRHSPVKGLNT